MKVDEALRAARDGDYKIAIPHLARAVQDAAYSSEKLNDAYTHALYRAGEMAALANAAFEIGDACLETQPAVALDYFQRALLGELDGACLRHIGEIFEGWAGPKPMPANGATRKIKKIAHVIGTLDPSHVPVRHLSLLIGSLKAQGVESQVFTTEWASSWFVNGNGCHVSPTGTDPGVVIASVDGNFIERAERVAAAIRAYQPNVALYHASLNEQITARVAAFRPAALQVNVAHGMEMDVDIFDGYVHLTKQRLAASHHADQPRHWIPPTTDIAQRIEACGPNMRAYMGLSSADTVSATLGDLRNVSDPAYLYALTGLLKVFPDHFHIFAGTGEVKTIRAALHAEGVLSRVRFLGSMSDAAPFMAVSDLYLCPIAQSDDASLLEAMGAGLPCIAAKRTGESGENSTAEILRVPELIAENELAYLQIAQSLIVDDVARLRMADLVRARFESEFAPSLLGPRYLGFLTGLIG